MFGLDRGTFEGFMTFADNRDLREQMYEGYRARGGQGGATDNRDEISEIAHLRAEAAQLLGYENHAAYQLETRMAKTPETAENFPARGLEARAEACRGGTGGDAGHRAG